MIGRWLCALGWHDWERIDRGNARRCRRCGKVQVRLKTLTGGWIDESE